MVNETSTQVTGMAKLPQTVCSENEQHMLNKMWK